MVKKTNIWKKTKWVGLETLEGIKTYDYMDRKPIKVKVSKGWEYVLEKDFDRMFKRKK